MNKSASNRRQVLGTTLLGACALSMGLMAAPAMAQGNVKVLSIGMPFSPLSMDPSISGNGRAGVHLSPAYEPLLRTQADGKFAPGLATAWQLSADSKEATFTLRQNAKFSDGEPVTAEAVKKSLEYFVGKKGPFAANFSAMTGIEVLDDGARVRVQPGATVRQVNARLARYGRRLGPDPASEIDEVWDDLLVVEYPSARAFLQMISDPEYQAGGVNRTAALADSRLFRTSPAA